MKAVFTFLISFTIFMAYSQTELVLEPFTTVVTGPHIKVKLTPGLNESVALEAKGVDLEKVVCKVKGKKLHIYLEDARNIEKQERHRSSNRKWSRGIYNDATVIAHVTYRQLNKLVTKGEEDVKILGKIGGTAFKFKSFGDQDVSFETIEAQKFRAKLYGSTSLKIASGYADLQRYKLYGEHNIQTENVETKRVRTANFGEVEMDVNSDIVQLTSFGTADIRSKKRSRIQRGIVIGETRFRSGSKS